MRADTLGCVLAGGLARRMGGGDKPMRLLGGRPMLTHVLARLAPQVASMVISANGDPARFAVHGLPVVADALPGHPGPLAGVLAALDHAADAGRWAWVATVPGDAPFIPRDLVGRLHAAREVSGLAVSCAASGGRRHPAIAVWPVSLRDRLRTALAAGERGVGAWAASQGCATADWPVAPLDPFLNVNTPEDLAHAERLLPPT